MKVKNDCGQLPRSILRTKDCFVVINRFYPLDQGCQIFQGTIYQSGEKVYQMTTKLPNAHKINSKYYNCPFQGPPKYTQIGIFWSEKKPTGNPALDRGRAYI
jgi:hypothetical protein